MYALNVKFSNKQLIGLIIFLLGFGTAFWGAFEMAYQSGSHPIWSGTWGYPFVHHYIFGFVMILVGVYLLFHGKFVINIISQ